MLILVAIISEEEPILMAFIENWSGILIDLEEVKILAN